MKIIVSSFIGLNKISNVGTPFEANFSKFEIYEQ